MSNDTLNKTRRRARIVTRRIVAGLTLHAAPAAAELDEALVAEGKKPLGLTSTIKAIAEVIQTRFDEYAVGQQVLAGDLAQTDEARHERDAALRALRTNIVTIARLVGSTYGRETMIRAKLIGSVPTAADSLLSFAQAFLEATANFEPPEPISRYASLDFAAARAEILQQTQVLTEALEHVSREIKEDQKARLERNALYISWEREARLGRDLAKTILLRVDQKELADRLLPSDRQIIGDAELPDSDEPESPSTDASRPDDPSEEDGPSPS